MAATLNALIYPSAPTVIVERRMIDVATIPPNRMTWWRPVVVVGDDPFDPNTQKKTGPATTIEANRVLDTYTVSSLSAQELSDRKDAKVNNLNTDALLTVLLALENDKRALRTKLNQLIDATGQAGTVTKFTAGQATQIDMTQLKAGLKALL